MVDLDAFKLMLKESDLGQRKIEQISDEILSNKSQLQIFDKISAFFEFLSESSNRNPGKTSFLFLCLFVCNEVLLKAAAKNLTFTKAMIEDEFERIMSNFINIKMDLTEKRHFDKIMGIWTSRKLVKMSLIHSLQQIEHNQKYLESVNKTTIPFNLDDLVKLAEATEQELLWKSKESYLKINMQVASEQMDMADIELHQSSMTKCQDKIKEHSKSRRASLVSTIEHDYLELMKSVFDLKKLDDKIKEANIKFGN